MFRVSLMPLDWRKLSPPAVYLKATHLFAFSFADFAQIQLKFVVRLGGNTASRSRLSPGSRRNNFLWLLKLLKLLGVSFHWQCWFTAAYQMIWSSVRLCSRRFIFTHQEFISFGPWSFLQLPLWVRLVKNRQGWLTLDDKHKPSWRNSAASQHRGRRRPIMQHLQTPPSRSANRKWHFHRWKHEDV